MRIGRKGSRALARRAAFVAAGLAALALAAGSAPAAAKEPGEGETKRLQGTLQGYDAEEETITVRAKGGEVVLNVKNDGSVLKRTTATVNSQPTKVSELPDGAPVIVYWREDPNAPGEKFARKVDAPNVPEELLEEYER